MSAGRTRAGPHSAEEATTLLDPQLWRRIVDRSPLAVALLTASDLRFVYVNTAYQAFAPDRPMIGRSMFEVWPEIADQVEPTVRRVAETGEPFCAVDVPLGIRPAVDAPPESRYFTLTYSRLPLDDEAGLLVEAVETTDEVSTRMEAERRAAEARQRADELDTVFEAMNESVLVYDAEGVISRANGSARETFGLDPVGHERAEIFRRRDVQDAQGRPAPLDQLPSARALRGERVVSERYSLRQADGRRRDVVVSAAPLVKDGKLTGAVSVWSDVTEQTRTERELEARDRDIRQAYVDVIASVTGGKLVLMTPEELQESLGERVSPDHEITSMEGLARARHQLAEDIRRAFPDALDLCGLIEPFGEAINNAVKHAGRGTFALYKKGDVAQIVVADCGPGIDFRTLPKATLLPGFSTTETLGIGFTMMLQYSDRLLLATRPGQTILVLECRVAAD